MKAIMTRFLPDMMRRIDLAKEAEGFVTRAAFVSYVVRKYIEDKGF